MQLALVYNLIAGFLGFSVKFFQYYIVLFCLELFILVFVWLVVVAYRFRAVNDLSSFSAFGVRPNTKDFSLIELGETGIIRGRNVLSDHDERSARPASHR